MKEKIMIFIIGLLVGAIVATGGAYLYINSNSANTNGQNMGMPGGTPPGMNDGSTPPEMPDGSTPPEMPSDNNTQSSNQSN